MNGRETPPVRPLWIALLAAVVLASVVVAVVELGEPELVPLVEPTGAVTILGDLTIDEDATARETVTARARISADRELVLPALVVRVRDTAGRAHDFPEQVDVALGTTPREFTFRREFPEPGTYTYSLAYRLDGDWVVLPPWQPVRIR